VKATLEVGKKELTIELDQGQTPFIFVFAIEE